MALLGMAIFHLLARRIRSGWPAVFAGVLLLWTRVVQESNAMKISSVARSSQGRAGKWPSYKYCVDRAPKAHGGDKPDISRADFTWCMTAIDWGHSPEDTASRLMEESAKARENGERYALDTALNAAAAVARRYHGTMEP